MVWNKRKRTWVHAPKKMNLHESASYYCICDRVNICHSYLRRYSGSLLNKGLWRELHLFQKCLQKHLRDSRGLSTVPTGRQAGRQLLPTNTVRFTGHDCRPGVLLPYCLVLQSMLDVLSHICPDAAAGGCSGSQEITGLSLYCGSSITHSRQMLLQRVYCQSSQFSSFY